MTEVLQNFTFDLIEDNFALFAVDMEVNITPTAHKCLIIYFCLTFDFCVFVSGFEVSKRIFN